MENIKLKENDTLSAAEETRLGEIEAEINEARLTISERYWQVGKLLAEVRDSGLYRAKYQTFERYVEDRWGITRARAYQLMNAKVAADNVNGLVDIPNESSARPLTFLTPKEQVKVSKVLAKSPKPLTASRVKETIETVLPRRGGIAATPRCPPKSKRPYPNIEAVIERIETWYAEEQNQLNQYPVLTPEQMVRRIVAMLRK